ncbi:AAA family ATPase [Mangrovibacterium marinum]|uniref:Cytidylate kinase n=1 Tax=Mangrovibacterium marinum TaxID=1639118 RepID=A0A2T5C4G6_9BACT|nr:cytidylate kinase-like family protein [Mangrovibacterium marinum]PTN09762.1 cytidylate kinase [Mangrovibacterium marinum]
MHNTLLSYMNKRLGEDAQKSGPRFKTAGPVITISREVGCGGILVAKQLAEELNKSVFCKQWQVISKEVLSQSAKELKVKQEKVDRLLSSSEKFTFDEILSAFSEKYYKSNRVIMKTVREVIYSFASDGCCIIVGRAGHLIADDIDNALHVRLTAPTRWRVDSIAARKQMNKSGALKYIQDIEKERIVFRDYFRKNKNEEEQFDVTIDVSRFDTDQVIKLIMAAFELRGIPDRMKKNVPYF